MQLFKFNMKKIIIFILLCYSFNTRTADNCLRFVERSIERGRPIAFLAGFIGFEMLTAVSIVECIRNGLSNNFLLASAGALTSLGLCCTSSLLVPRVLDRLRRSRENYELVQQADPDRVDIQ